MQKIIGCILIITAGSGMGWLKALELQKHLEEEYLEELCYKNAERIVQNVTI